MEHPVAIVTGAGRGIGRATAKELGRLGYRLVLVSRTPAELAESARSLEAPLVVPADVTQVDQVRQVAAKALETFGRIDALVNCAGLAPVCPLEQMSPQQWHAVLDTNLSAVFYLCQAVWPAFRRQQTGVVVNLSSLACRDPFPGLGAYGAAKAGLNLLGLALAREGQEIGVRVHTLALGTVETAMFRQILTPQQYPTAETMDPAEVAHLIGLCVTGELKYTSGEVIFMHKRV